MLAPIVLFVYNREDHTRRTLETLKKNLGAKESRIYIFSDGAKTEKENENVLRVRKLIREYEGDFLEEHTEYFGVDSNFCKVIEEG